MKLSVLHGHLTAHAARGTVAAYRYAQDGPAWTKCTSSTDWRSTTTRPTTTAGPAAFFSVLPFRYGRPGAWSYYLIVKLSGCSHANRARVAVSGGPSRTTGCHGQARLGPLTPQRTYRVTVTALELRRGRVVHRAAAVPSLVYLPGEDGDWVRLRTRP